MAKRKKWELEKTMKSQEILKKWQFWHIKPISWNTELLEKCLESPHNSNQAIIILIESLSKGHFQKWKLFEIDRKTEEIEKMNKFNGF